MPNEKVHTMNAKLLKTEFDSDPLLRGRLISLSRVDGHAKWVSRAVLQRMGIMEDIPGGIIVRDISNEPTGR